MPVSLEEYRPGIDDTEVLTLRAAVWGPDHLHTQPGFLDWIFRRNPAGPGQGVLLRRDGDLIGFAGLTPRLISVSGATLRVAQVIDYMVDPSVRGGLSGVYGFRVLSRWAELAQDAGYRFGVGFPNANSVRIATSNKLKWRPTVSPVLLVRPLPGFRLQERLPAALPPVFATIGGRLLAAGIDLKRRAQRDPRPDRIMNLTDFDERFDALWRRMVARLGVGFCRDSAYLRWRYIGHPAYTYRIAACETAGELRAFVVMSPRTLLGLESLLVVDGAWDGSGPEAMVGLLDHVVDQAREAKTQIVGALASAHSAFYRALRRAGFLPVPRRFDPKPFVLTTRALAEEPGAASEPAQWHLTWGDMDVV